MTERAKWLLAVGLGVTWILLLAERWADQAGPPRVPLSYTTGQATAPGPQPDSPFGTIEYPVDTLLSHTTLEVRHNLFAPLAGRRREPPRRFTASNHTPSQQSTAGSKPAATPPPPSPEEVARKRARDRLSHFRYFGYVTRGEEARAFLGNGSKLFIVRPGDTMDGGIEVVAIDPTLVRLRDAPTQVEVTLTLAGRGLADRLT